VQDPERSGQYLKCQLWGTRHMSVILHLGALTCVCVLGPTSCSSDLCV